MKARREWKDWLIVSNKNTSYGYNGQGNSNVAIFGLDSDVRWVNCFGKDCQYVKLDVGDSKIIGDE